MPDQYTNPTIKPCAGSFTWVPPTSPTIGGVNPTVGFENLIIDKGVFRNYYVLPNTDKSAHAPLVIVNSTNSVKGDLYSPIINATRPLAINGSPVQGNNNNFVVSTEGDENLVEYIFSSSDRLWETLSK